MAGSPGLAVVAVSSGLALLVTVAPLSGASVVSVTTPTTRPPLMEGSQLRFPMKTSSIFHHQVQDCVW
jgi:hypothetical protein